MIEAQDLEMQQMEDSLLDFLRGTFGELKFSVIEALEQAAVADPSAIAFMEPDRESLTYGRLLALTRETVQTLNSMGFTSASRIAVVLPTNTAAASVHICVVAGMCIMPLNTSAPRDEYERYFKQGQMDAVLLEQHETPAAREAAAHLGIPVLNIAYAADGPVGVFAIQGAADRASDAPQFARPDDLAVYFFSSGTTSYPKMLPLSQRLVLLRAYFEPSTAEVAGRVRVNFTLSQHYAGWIAPLRAIVRRQQYNCIYSLDIATLYHRLALYRPSSFIIMPTILQGMIADAPRHRAVLEQLNIKEILVASAALPESLFHDAQRVFAAPIRVYYTTTEVGTVSDIVYELGSPIYNASALGKRREFARVKIAGDDGVALPATEIGEIWVRSPMMFSGYENNDEANAESLRDGWVRTGDAGYLDANDYLFLTGRVKEIINRGGNKISPSEIDAVLVQHPAVLEVATFAFPHAALGEDVAAAVVLRQEGATERELRSFAATRLQLSKVPSRFVFVEELPKTAVGKVRRAALTEQFKALLGR